MEETQEREEEFDELDTSEDEEDGDDPMGLRAAEVLIVREAEGEQEHEEQEMVCFVDLPRVSPFLFLEMQLEPFSELS